MRKSLSFFVFLLFITIKALASESLVVVYSTSWCGHCKSAKTYLENNHIEYTNYDIETSEIGRKKYTALNGRGVPLIYVGEERIEGFKKATLEKALKANGLLKD